MFFIANNELHKSAYVRIVHVKVQCVTYVSEHLLPISLVYTSFPKMGEVGGGFFWDSIFPHPYKNSSPIFGPRKMGEAGRGFAGLCELHYRVASLQWS